MTASNATYLFVGGASHTQAFFENAISHFAARGFEASAIAYPTCGKNSENTRQWDEVVAIRNAIIEQIDGRSRNVILVLHDYGGLPGSRAITGLDNEARRQKGKATGVVEIVFIAAFLLQQHAPTGAFSNVPPWMDVENGCRRPNETAMQILFSDMQPKDQRYWLSQFQWHLNDFSALANADAPWHLSIPKTYIITTEDQAMILDFQFDMLKEVIDETWAIKSIKSGHEPFLSQPKNLAYLILQPFESTPNIESELESVFKLATS